MLPIPKIKKGALAPIPASVLFLTRDILESNLKTAARTYLKLGGNPKLKWSPRKSLCDVAESMVNALDGHIKSLLFRDRHCADFAREHSIESEITSFDDDAEIACYNVKEKKYPADCYRLVVLIRVGNYCTPDISFLQRIQDKKLFEFMRQLISTAAASSPSTTHEEIHEMLFDFREADNDNEGEKENIAKAQNELALYRERFSSPYKMPYKKRLIWLKRHYPSVARKLTEEQRKIVSNAFPLFKSLSELKAIDNYIDAESLGLEEAPGMDKCFNVVWAGESTLCEEWGEYLNELYAHFGCPTEGFMITSRKDLDNARRWFEYICHAARFFYELDESVREGVWDENSK